MSDSHAFNPELFSTNAGDYQLESVAIVPQSNVFKGTFGPLQLPCAVRVVKMDESEVELYENEVYIDRLTKHPNVMKLLCHFLCEDRTWYRVFPYTPHKSLDLQCQPFGLPEPVIAFAMADILQGLDYLHRNNIIHRAIQSAHILLFGDLEHSSKFVLTGLKHCLDMTKKDDLQAYDYPKDASKILKCIAPEVLEQNIIGYNFKSDIYSLGLTCCELANGIVPFGNMQPDQLLFYKIIGDTPGPLDSTCEEMKIIREYSDQLEISLQKRHAAYLKRTFSTHFHHFVTHACLHIEQSHRLPAGELLVHSFMSHNLEKHGPCKMALLAKHLGGKSP